MTKPKNKTANGFRSPAEEAKWASLNRRIKSSVERLEKGDVSAKDVRSLAALLEQSNSVSAGILKKAMMTMSAQADAEMDRIQAERKKKGEKELSPKDFEKMHEKILDEAMRKSRKDLQDAVLKEFSKQASREDRPYRRGTVADVYRRAEEKRNRELLAKEFKEDSEYQRKRLAAYLGEVKEELQYATEDEKENLEDLRSTIENGIRALKKGNVDQFKNLERRIEESVESVSSHLSRRLELTDQGVRDSVERSQERRSRFKQSAADFGMRLADRVGIGRVSVGSVIRGGQSVGRGIKGFGKFAKSATRAVSTVIDTSARASRGIGSALSGLVGRRDSDENPKTQKGLLSSLNRAFRETRKFQNQVTEKLKSPREALSKRKSRLGALGKGLALGGIAALAGAVAIPWIKDKLFGDNGILTMDSLKTGLSKSWSWVKDKLFGDEGLLTFDNIKTVSGKVWNAVKGMSSDFWEWIKGQLPAPIRKLFEKEPPSPPPTESDLRSVQQQGAAFGSPGKAPRYNASQGDSLKNRATRSNADQGRAPATIAPSSTNTISITPKGGGSTPPSPSTSSSSSSPSSSPPAQAAVSAKGQMFTTSGNVDMSGLNPKVSQNFNSMAAEYNQLTGKKIQVNSAYRSPEKQRKLYEENLRNGSPKLVAPPGRSAHETGLAIDIQSSQANEMDKMGLLSKYGFSRPLLNASRPEAWHLQAAGTAAPLAKAGVFSADYASDQSPKMQKPKSTTVAKAEGFTLPDPDVSDIVMSGKGNSQGSSSSRPAMAMGGANNQLSVRDIPMFSSIDGSLAFLNMGGLA